MDDSPKTLKDIAEDNAKALLELAEKDKQITLEFALEGVKSVEDVQGFSGTLLDVLNTFVLKNKKYKDSWKNDGMGVRVLMAEVNAKFRRQLAMLWDPEGVDAMGDPEHRAHIYETVVDMILYQLMIVRRMEIEYGEFNRDSYEQHRDKE